jgi:hypothetical protein
MIISKCLFINNTNLKFLYVRFQNRFGLANYLFDFKLKSIVFSKFDTRYENCHKRIK